MKQLNPDEQPSVSILQETVLVLFLVKNKDLWSVCHEIIEDVNHCGFGGSVSGVLMVGLLFGIASKGRGSSNTVVHWILKYFEEIRNDQLFQIEKKISSI